MTSPLTADVLVYDFKAAGDPQLSPDGERVLYSLGQVERGKLRGTSQIWICNRDGSGARQLTWNGERNGGGRWSPDGAQIAFVSDRSGGKGKEKGAALCILSLGGGEAREITRHRNGIGDLAWSPDGTQIAYSTSFDPENPNEEEWPADKAVKVRVTRRIDYKQDNRGYLHDTRSQIFVVDVASVERRKITGEAADYNFPQWSPDGKTIAAQRPNHNGMQSQLALIDVASGKTTLIGPEEGVVGVWSWSPSGERIVFSGDTKQTYQTDFFVLTVASGEVQRLTDDLAVLPVAGFPTIVGPAQPVWLDDDQVLVHAMRAGASGLYAFNLQTTGIEPVVNWRAMNAQLSTDRSGRYAAVSYSSWNAQGEIAIADTQTEESTIITHVNDAVLAEHPTAEPERFTIKRGKYEIEAWLLKPYGFDPSKKYPLILDVHGGPNGFYGWGFNANQQAFAAAGFVTVFANPRGSSSYGRDFTTQVLGDWGYEDYQDLMAVVDEALKQPYVDAERTGIYGYSYGGYMTSWTIGQTDRFKAAVCGAPCFDLESFYGTSDIGHVFGRSQFGSKPHEGEEWYKAHSPSTFAHRAKTPTLIVHGEEDHRCPIGQGEQMFIALLDAGVETEFARYPGGSHLFLRGGPPAHREDFLNRTVGWFKDHLGGAE
ncbi:MAG: S9 family peptidase [Chloroflexia bacterium]